MRDDITSVVNVDRICVCESITVQVGIRMLNYNLHHNEAHCPTSHHRANFFNRKLCIHQIPTVIYLPSMLSADPHAYFSAVSI